MIDERYIMVDLHIYISVKKILQNNIVSLVDIAYPRGFSKVLLKKTILCKTSCKQFPTFHPPYLAGTTFLVPVPRRYTSFLKHILLIKH